MASEGRAPQRYIDIETGVIHVDNGLGNYHVLCGDHMAGSDEKNYPMIETFRHKITCRRCLKLIETVKEIPSRHIGEPEEEG